VIYVLNDLVDWATHFVDFIDLEQHSLLGFSSFIW